MYTLWTTEETLISSRISSAFVLLRTVITHYRLYITICCSFVTNGWKAHVFYWTIIDRVYANIRAGSISTRVIGARVGVVTVDIEFLTYSILWITLPILTKVVRSRASHIQTSIASNICNSLA
jgi:hypothetical protein